MASYRYYQQEADDSIFQELLDNDKCIVKMFCGTGKSLLMRRCRIAQNCNLLVYVFPSLSLIEQFYNDYLNDIDNELILRISSDTESSSTTNYETIQNFLSKNCNKIVCVTYQSYKTLIDNLNGILIDTCIYDEAHHAVGQTYQKLIFENSFCKKQIFFTATPKNANGIIMYDRMKLEENMCGKLVYDYSYLRGVFEDYLNPFEIRIDLFTENTNKSLFESIARAILTTGNNRVLTFHADVNAERDTSVNLFVNQKDFIKSFQEVKQREFASVRKYNVKNIKMIGLSSSINIAERKKLLTQFDETPDNHIFIISSCETIGEGIDTKNANMCVFVDPKSSYVKIIQNIGRIVRKPIGKLNAPNSTVLIPCWVDKNKYINCGGDKDKCDEVIRQDMSERGNFNGILNVLSALRQEDEDIYDICLHYPDTFSPQEIKSNLEKQGFTINDPVGDGGIVETCEHLLDKELDYDDFEECETDNDIAMKIAEDNDVCVEIHTDSLENPIEKYNPNGKETIRVYKCEQNEDEDDTPVYQPIVKKDGVKKSPKSDQIKTPDRHKRSQIKVHTNPDVKVLWKISSDIDLVKDMCSCVIDCEIVDNWFDRFEELKKFIDENKRKPIPNVELEKTIFNWMKHQIRNYKHKKNSMKNEVKYNKWKEFIELYNEYMMTFDDIWEHNFDKLKEFININKKIPKKILEKENEKLLNDWLHNQKIQYNKGAMNKQRTDKWSEFLVDYREYFEDIWEQKFIELKDFINANKNKPSDKSKNLYEKNLGRWLATQQTNYKKKVFSMKDEEKYNKWTKFLNEHKEYFVNRDAKWEEDFINLKDFINTNKNKPSNKSKNVYEKYLGQWLVSQQTNYKKKDRSMKDEEKYNKWTKFLNEYKEYFVNRDTKWEEIFIELKDFIHLNKKCPSQYSKNKTEQTLANWLKTYNQEYKKKEMKDNERYTKWNDFLEEYKEYFTNNDDKWEKKLIDLKDFINKNNRRPNKKLKNEIEKNVGSWLSNQLTHYKNKTGGMKDEERCNKLTEFLEEFKEYFDVNDSISTTSSLEEDEEEIIIIPKKKSMKLTKPKKVLEKQFKETPEERRQRNKSELSVLHQRYKTMTSSNLHTAFKEDIESWHNYHKIAEENEKSFPDEGIPRNRIIQELDKIKTKRRKLIVDMGCGKAQIAEHFKHDNRFEFINYDHIATNDKVTECDISNVPLEDDSVEICILSLAMWGSNCGDYVKEAKRILESNGKLYIIEPTKRWTNDNDIPGKRLNDLLVENGFKIVEESIEKFSLFVCIKIN